MTLPGIQRYVITHNGEGPYKHKVCGKAFDYSSSFLIQERNHSGEKLYECRQRGKHSVYLILFEDMHEITLERNVTYVKNVAFSHSSSLQIHERTHTKINAVKLSLIPSHFQIHERTHTGRKYLVFRQCGRAFSVLCSFRRHKRTHNGEALNKESGKGLLSIGFSSTHKNVKCRELILV
jgi:KRAB domain-containing zinc finger protein